MSSNWLPFPSFISLGGWTWFRPWETNACLSQEMCMLHSQDLQLRPLRQNPRHDPLHGHCGERRPRDAQPGSLRTPSEGSGRVHPHHRRCLQPPRLLVRHTLRHEARLLPGGGESLRGGSVQTVLRRHGGYHSGHSAAELWDGVRPAVRRNPAAPVAVQKLRSALRVQDGVVGLHSRVSHAFKGQQDEPHGGVRGSMYGENTAAVRGGETGETQERKFWIFLKVLFLPNTQIRLTWNTKSIYYSKASASWFSNTKGITARVKHSNKLQFQQQLSLQPLWTSIAHLTIRDTGFLK